MLQLNLDKYYNHSLFYNKNHEMMSKDWKNRHYGIFEIILLDIPEIINLNKQIKYIPKKEKEYKFDNVVCDGQVIKFNAMSVHRIYIIGLCEYGTISENITIGNDVEEFNYTFIMKTFHTNSFQGLDNNEKNKKCRLIKQYWGNDNQKHNIYSYNICLEKNLNLNKIILPINLSVHILGIILI